MGRDDLPRALARGAVGHADMTAADAAMVRYAVALTRAPGRVAAAHVDELRTHGFDDRGIHDICHVASYYNYVNRLADGLGVELEEGWREEQLILTRQEFEALRA